MVKFAGCYIVLLGVMMWGAKINNPDGSLWLSPDYVPLNLWETGVLAAPFPATFISTVPSGKSASFFISQTGDGFLDARQVIVNGYHALTITAAQSSVTSIKIYCFANLARETGDYGIRFYNENGDLTYSSEMKPLELHVINTDQPWGNTTLDQGRKVAVLPAFSGMASQFDSGIGNYRIFSMNAGAVGNSITVRLRLLTGSASGPVAYTYTNQIYFIHADKYD